MILETGARFSENRSTILREPEHTQAGEPEHISVGARFSENQSMVLQEPEQVLWESEHTQAGKPEHT